MRQLVTWIGCFLYAGALAQVSHPDVTFEHVAIPGTIRSSQVNDILQDHYGLIWIAGDGLYRYDGYKFTAYKEISPTQGITGREIYCLLADSVRNKLYLGTHSYGLVEYDYITDKLKVIPSEGGVPIISLIAQTKDGTVWAGSFSTGLYKMANDTLVRIPDPQQKLNNPTSLLAIGNKLLVDKLKTLYVLHHGVIKDTIAIEYPSTDFDIHTRITTMTLDKTGKIWMGMERAGVLVYDTLQKKFTNYLSRDISPFYHRINEIMAAEDSSIWILTKANGIAVYTPSTGNFIHLTKNPLVERTLSGNNCTAVIQDKSGIIWVGAIGDLNKYDPSKIRFRHIYSNPYSSLSLNDNMVRSVFEDKGGKLWIGTDGGVIHIYDRKNVKLEKIQVNFQGSSLPVVPVYFQELDETNMVVASSQGLLLLNRKTKTFNQVAALEKLFKGRMVRQVLVDSTQLWILYSGSIVRYNLRTHETKMYREFAKDVKNATTIYIDSQKRLWVGAKNGVSLYLPELDDFRHFEFEENINRPQGTYFMVLSIYEYQQKLWVGTFNSGLWTMSLGNLDQPEIKNITDKDGLPNNTVYATLEDTEGNVWMSTNQGISKYEVASGRFLNFGLADGIQHEEFNRLAFTKCASGDIVFGGINGLTLFNPKRIIVKEENYVPVLVGLTVFNEDAPTSFYTGIFRQPETKLRHNENNIDFTFFVPNYQSPKRFEVLYKLQGYDPDWIKAETNTIHYSNLSPGSYQLNLKTVSSSGAENQTSFLVTIEYPIWQTWWFILLSVGIVALLVYTIIQSNIRKTRHDKEMLERLLHQRTQEIEKSREALETLNQKKDVIFSILSHDLRAPLTTLKGFLSILIDNNEMLTKDEVKKHASNIRNSVTSSLDLIDNTLFWSLSQTGNITYTPVEFSLNTMLTKLKNLYQLTAEKKQLGFNIVCQENITLYGDENMIYVALRNLVSNALKFTPDGKAVNMRVEKNHQYAEISIQDQGIGMSEAYLEKIMKEEHFQVKMGTANEKGTGLGLILCKKFIQVNKGNISVTSTEGKGSEFKVSLPLPTAKD